ERVDDQTEGDVTLKLGRTPVKDEVPTRLRTPTQLRQQARLPDPRLACHLDRPTHAGAHPVERALELCHLEPTADEHTGALLLCRLHRVSPLTILRSSRAPVHRTGAAQRPRCSPRSPTRPKRQTRFATRTKLDAALSQSIPGYHRNSVPDEKPVDRIYR